MVPRPNLHPAFEAGRAQWPDVRLSLEEFATRIDALEVESRDLSIRGPDLYLAAACAAGDDGAIRCFDAAFVCSVDERTTRSR